MENATSKASHAVSVPTDGKETPQNATSAIQGLSSQDLTLLIELVEEEYGLADFYTTSAVWLHDLARRLTEAL